MDNKPNQTEKDLESFEDAAARLLAGLEQLARRKTASECRKSSESFTDRAENGPRVSAGGGTGLSRSSSSRYFSMIAGEFRFAANQNEVAVLRIVAVE